MSSPLLESTREVAHRLGVTPRSVARLVDTGALTPVMKAPGLRGAYFFDPAAVDELLEQRQAVAS